MSLKGNPTSVLTQRMNGVLIRKQAYTIKRNDDCQLDKKCFDHCEKADFAHATN